MRKAMKVWCLTFDLPQPPAAVLRLVYCNVMWVDLAAARIIGRLIAFDEHRFSFRIRMTYDD